MQPMQRDWDIFCRVIDNFGDIGVCWRLARQLANEYPFNVRLWVDDLKTLQPLCPAVDTTLSVQFEDKVEICLWTDDFPDVKPATHVIEAFACELPASFLASMGRMETAPHWFNLEYLTAESWAEEWHGMVSPHPSLPLRKTFFFPGFSSRSGGLLRESHLIDLRDAFRRGLSKDKLEISLFCYDNAPVGELLDAIAQGKTPVRCFLPPGKPTLAVERYLGSAEAQTRGQLELAPLPFLSQSQYDEILWRCDINFVRGEDSFVRAQWAGRPFVWQIYPQEENAHWPKLNAFIDLYVQSSQEETALTMKQLFLAWNRGFGVKEAWCDFLDNLTKQSGLAKNWSENLVNQPDLVSRLIKFTGKPV